MADSERLDRAPGGTASRPAPPPPGASLRQRLFMGLGLVVVAGALIWGIWYVLVGSHYVSTDDAYVDAKSAQITPQVSGTILSVAVEDTQHVKRGDVLLVIDPADAKLAAAQADANYNRALSHSRQFYANIDAAEATITARRADLERAKIDFQRRQALKSTGAISGDELTIAQNALDTAEAMVKAAEQNQLSDKALITGPDPEKNPEVLAAAAMRDKSHLDLDRTVIRAPIDGIIARSSIQIGQHVDIGATLMSVVPIAQSYVNANFKEGQLTEVHPGQKATLTSDLYGSDVVYHGKVEGIGGGTGSAFAIIPAQNATGNWIKIVQRLPVRIELDQKELEDHPLRVGLSMSVKVDISDKGDSGS